MVLCIAAQVVDVWSGAIVLKSRKSHSVRSRSTVINDMRLTEVWRCIPLTEVLDALLYWSIVGYGEVQSFPWAHNLVSCLYAFDLNSVYRVRRRKLTHWSYCYVFCNLIYGTYNA